MSSNAPLLETTSFTTTPASSPEAAPAAAEPAAVTPNGGIPQPPTTADQPPSAPETSSAATEPSSTTTAPSSTTTATTTTTRLHPIIVNASSSSSSNSTASPKPVVTKPRIVKTVRFDLTFEQDDEDPSKTGIAEIRQVVVNADGDTTPPGTIHTFFNPLNLLQQPPPPPPMRDSEPNSKKWTHGGVVVLMGAIAVAIMVMFYAKTNGDSSNDANKGLDVRASINDSSLFNSDIQARINVGQDGYLRMRPSLDGRAIAPRSKGVNHMIQELLYIWTTYEHQDDAVDCPPIMMPRADHPCRFEMPLLGDSCRPENGFGYLDYKPCFFLDLVQTGQWIPGPYYKGYSSETKTPLWAPVNCYLWVRSKKGAPLQQGYLSSVWPSFGVPRWFFPASASTNFYSPLVAIQLDLTDLPPNSDFVTLMCQIMASNGRLLAADATWATMSVAEIVKEQINKKANDAKKKEELAARLGGNSTTTTEATAQAEALRGEPRGLSGKSYPWDKNGAFKKFSSFS